MAIFDHLAVVMRWDRKGSLISSAAVARADASMTIQLQLERNVRKVVTNRILGNIRVGSRQNRFIAWFVSAERSNVEVKPMPDWRWSIVQVSTLRVTTFTASTQHTQDAYRLRNEQHWGERPLGSGGGMGEVATWNRAARLLVNSGHGGFPVAVAWKDSWDISH